MDVKLEQLRAKIVEFQEGTPQPARRTYDIDEHNEKIELTAIHKTLNVVLAEIDKLRPAPFER